MKTRDKRFFAVLAASLAALAAAPVLGEEVSLAFSSLWKQVTGNAVVDATVEGEAGAWSYVAPDGSLTDNFFDAARYTVAGDDNALRVLVSAISEASCDWAVQAGLETRDLNELETETVFGPGDIQAGDKVALKVYRRKREASPSSDCRLVYDFYRG